jgi:hypothetical protein
MLFADGRKRSTMNAVTQAKECAQNSAILQIFSHVKLERLTMKLRRNVSDGTYTSIWYVIQTVNQK